MITFMAYVTSEQINIRRWISLGNPGLFYAEIDLVSSGECPPSLFDLCGKLCRVTIEEAPLIQTPELTPQSPLVPDHDHRQSGPQGIEP